MLQQLLAIDPFADPRVTGRGRDSMGRFSLEDAQLYSHLAPAKRDAAARLLHQSRTQRESLKASLRNAGLGNDEVTVRRQSQEHDAELRKLLTPEEFAEVTYREAARHIFHAGVDLTAAELRSVAQIHARAHASNGLALFERVEYLAATIDTAASDEAVARDIQKLLGPQTWTDYQRAQQPGFEGLLDFTAENGLPKHAAIHAGDVLAAAQKAVAAINNDETLSADETARRLRELQTATTGKLKLELGTTLAEKYFMKEGAWIESLAQPWRKRIPKPAIP